MIPNLKKNYTKYYNFLKFLIGNIVYKVIFGQIFDMQTGMVPLRVGKREYLLYFTSFFFFKNNFFCFNNYQTLPRLVDAPSLENVHAKIVSCGARHSTVVTGMHFPRIRADS